MATMHCHAGNYIIGIPLYTNVNSKLSWLTYIVPCHIHCGLHSLKGNSQVNPTGQDSWWTLAILLFLCMQYPLTVTN